MLSAEFSDLVLNKRFWEVGEEFIRYRCHNTTFDNCSTLPSGFSQILIRTKSLHRFNAVKLHEGNEFRWVFLCCSSEQKLHTHSGHLFFL